MSSSKREEAGWVAQEGTSDRQGASMTPFDLDEDDAQEQPSEPEAMPMGYPISPEQYRKMKEEALRQDVPSGNEAQQDASTDECDR